MSSTNASPASNTSSVTPSSPSGSDTLSASGRMEVDGGGIGLSGLSSSSTLKRSSSAPMINQLNSNSPMSGEPISPSPIPPLRDLSGCGSAPRPRRFSTSCSPLPPMRPSSGPSSPKMTHRVNQLRREETVVDVLDREAAHERELNSAMVVSLSCEDLTLVTGGAKDASENGKNNGQLKSSASSVSSYPLCSTPSPTRGTPLRAHSLTTFKTSLTPSPTRSISRSQSPIRPSSLSNSVKRKFELDDSEPPAKKMSSLLIQPSRISEPMVIAAAPRENNMDQSTDATASTTPTS